MKKLNNITFSSWLTALSSLFSVNLKIAEEHSLIDQLNNGRPNKSHYGCIWNGSVASNELKLKIVGMEIVAVEEEGTLRCPEPIHDPGTSVFMNEENHNNEVIRNCSRDEYLVFCNQLVEELIETIHHSHRLAWLDGGEIWWMSEVSATVTPLLEVQTCHLTHPNR